MLKRRFTTSNLLFLSINGMIGSAWLFAPLYAAKIAGPLAIAAWLIGGFATLLVAMTFAELATILPVAGGTIYLPLLSHGRPTSFLISFAAWLSCVTMPPIEVQAVLQYASGYFPFLTYIAANGAPQLSFIGLVIAAVMMILLSIINIASFRGLIQFNFALFIFKVVVIIATISWLIGTEFHPQNFIVFNHEGFMSGFKSVLVALATGGVAFAFTGFKHGIELGGEAKDPHRSVPIAIIGSVSICLVLYLGLQVALIGVLDSEALANGWRNLHFAGDIGPFVGIAVLLGLGLLAKFLWIDAAVSPLGAGLVYVTSTARLVYAMGKKGYLFEKMTLLNDKGFPIIAIFFNCIVGIFLFLPLPGWQNMVSFLVSAVFISYAMGPISLLALRLNYPDLSRNIKIPFPRTCCFLAFYFCNLMGYWTGWETISKLSIAFVIGFAIFSAVSMMRDKQEFQRDLSSSFWIFPYIGGLAVLSYLGSFGGLNILEFGPDFLAIAAFSAVILLLSVRSRKAIIVGELDGFCAEAEVFGVAN